MIITDFAVVGFAGPETLPIISEIFQSILSGTRGKDEGKRREGKEKKGKKLIQLFR
jgi:hypothetical protein